MAPITSFMKLQRDNSRSNFSTIRFCSEIDKKRCKSHLLDFTSGVSFCCQSYSADPRELPKNNHITGLTHFYHFWFISIFLLTGGGFRIKFKSSRKLFLYRWSARQDFSRLFNLWGICNEKTYLFYFSSNTGFLRFMWRVHAYSRDTKRWNSKKDNRCIFWLPFLHRGKNRR